jgi:hypothetical protein
MKYRITFECVDWHTYDVEAETEEQAEKAAFDSIGELDLPIESTNISFTPIKSEPITNEGEIDDKIC